MSGAGLVVLVGTSLWRAFEQARVQQQLDAQNGATATAEALRAALRQRALLTIVPPDARFVVENGRCRPPADVGWLEVDAPAPVDPRVLGRLVDADRAEFVRGDRDAAAAALAELLGDQGPQGRARWRVLAAAAWQEQRAGDGARVAALAGELDAALAPLAAVDLADPAAAEAVVASSLLAAARALPQPEFVPRLLPALPEGVAVPLFSRLSERGVDASAWRAAHDAIVGRRALHRAAQVAIARGAPAGTSALPGGLLLWFPAAADAPAVGAVVAAAALVDALHHTTPGALPPIPWLGDVVAAAPTRGGVTVVDGGLWVVPRTRDVEVPWTARPAAALIAAIALLLVLAGSGLFAARAVRQEAAAVRERAEFLTVVTHELKTPLAAIRLLAEMLVEGRVPAGRTDEYYRLLAGEGARLSMLIENVLDLGRIERGERSYDLRRCDLAEVVREATMLFAPIAQRDGIELQSRFDAASASAMAHADRGALLQALLNVLDNAAKYGVAGGVVEVRAGATPAGFELAIRDRGPGVPAGEREAIFGRFRRGDAHRHGSIPGIGLGLHLARAIARRHGGDLVCRAPQDGGPGAEFAFTLPLLRAELREVTA